MTHKLFKFGSVEDELMASMEASLVKNQKDMAFGHDKLIKAVDHLSAAAEIFDNTGFGKEAEIITRLIEKIAQDKSVGELIEEELGAQLHPINKMIEEDLVKKEIDDLIQSEQELDSRQYHIQKMLDEEMSKKKV